MNILPVELKKRSVIALNKHRIDGYEISGSCTGNFYYALNNEVFLLMPVSTTAEQKAKPPVNRAIFFNPFPF